MTDTTDGRQVFKKLFANGYTPIPITRYDRDFTIESPEGPLSRPGGKAPGRFDPSTNQWYGLPGWQNLFYSPPAPKILDRWESWSEAPGAGILTGCIIAVDIDITHEGLNTKAFKSAGDILGNTPFIRYGNAPKALLVYRLEGPPISKMKSARYDFMGHKNQAVEILGKGQQFVAYGTHPATKRPYHWPNESLIDTPADKLPAVTPEQLKAFIADFEFKAESCGATCVSLGRTDQGDSAPHDLPDKRGLIADAMATLPAELAEDYHSWIRVGLALKAALPHDELLAKDLWHSFSAKSESKYDPAITENRWDTFRSSRIGAGTLYRLAKEAGWNPPISLPEEDFDPVELPADIEPTPERFEWINEYEESTLPPREWLLGRQLLRGQTTTLVAPGGVGKSTLTLTWAASIATKRDLCNAAPHQTGKVWIINNEDDNTELKRRFAAIRQAFNLTWEEVKDRIVITGGASKRFAIARRGPTGITAAAELQQSIDFVKQHGIVAVFIDPLVSTHPAEENNNSEMEEVMSLYRRLSHETGCALCLVHHTSKPQGGSSDGFAGSQHAGRGASAVVNAARISLTLFDMSEKDAQRYSIPDDQRSRYVRLDDAKANLSLRSSSARWFYRESITLANGDDVGALKPVTLTEARIQAATDLAGALAELDDLTAKGRVSLMEAAKHLQSALVIDAGITIQAAMARLKKLIEKPVRVLPDDNIFIWFEQDKELPKGKGKASNYVVYGRREN